MPDRTGTGHRNPRIGRLVVVSVRRYSRARNFHFADREQPLLRELNFPDLLSGIDDDRIWNADFHLVFDKSAICESLDQVIGIDSAAGRRRA